MRPIRSQTLTLIVGLTLLMAGVIPSPAQPAAAASPLVISLGTHRFGHLAAPQAIVAKAGPNEVGWESPPPGADGVTFGPWSFDVAPDGSIWLLDEVNERLLVWRPGQPARPARTARTVPLPFKAAGDLALGTDGTIYVTSMPAGGSGDYLYALTPTGQVRWKDLLPEQRTVGRLLTIDGVVYYHFTRWTPMTDRHGQPLPAAEQHRLASPHQPLPDGLRLSETLVPPHELRLSLIDTAGHTVRGWRITSQAELGGIAAKAAMIHDDLVVVLSIDEQTKNKAFWEYLVLRLPPTGGTNVRFAIAPESRVMWGSEYLTGLQVGPDGQLYQLHSDRPTGISIARYYLTPNTTPPATTTPGGAAPPSSMAPPATSTPAPTVTEPATPPVQAQPSGRSVLPWVMAVAVPALLAAGVGGWRWYRRRHPAGSRRHGRPRPAH